jgi:hypothetical protein
MGTGWMGEIKSDRIVFYEDTKYHLWELLDKLRWKWENPN